MSAGRRIHAVLDSFGKKPTPIRGGKFMALCPAHDDRNPSLSVGEMPDGRVLIHCHAGCSPSEVMESMSLRLSDLYPDGAMGEWGPQWWASNRKEREEQATRDFADRLTLEVHQAKRARGQELTQQELREEREAFKRVSRRG